MSRSNGGIIEELLLPTNKQLSSEADELLLR